MGFNYPLNVQIVFVDVFNESVSRGRISTPCCIVKSKTETMIARARSAGLRITYDTVLVAVSKKAVTLGVKVRSFVITTKYGGC
jgi:hypothetical protein